MPRRAGRPRKQGVPRAPNGRMVRPTPEVAQKRLHLVGPGNDATLSTTPLDLLRARSIIDGDCYSAAPWFGWLLGLILGNGPLRPRSTLTERSGGEPSDGMLRRASLEYCYVCECMPAADRNEPDQPHLWSCRRGWPR